MISQKQRVLNALRQAGPDGIDQTQFDLPLVIDGGPPIKRVAARIEELKDDGFLIGVRSRRRHKCVVYRLDREPARRVQAAAADGWVRGFVCRRCFACLRDESAVCGGSWPVQTPLAQLDARCLKVDEREAQIAA